MGLICPILHECGHNGIVASRIKGSNVGDRLDRIRSTREIRVSDLSGGGQYSVPIAEFLDTGTTDGRVAFTEMISRNDVAVLVTAARSGLNDRCAEIRGTAPTRTQTLAAVTADNSPPPSWFELSSAGVVNLECRPSIADRICLRFPETHSEVDVMVESHNSWILERDRNAVFDQLLTVSSSVHIVDELEPWRLRKLLCVNGLQLAFAILARLDGYPRLNLWILHHLDQASEIAQVWSDCFAAYSGENLNAIRGLCDYSLERFVTTPDRSGRIVGLKEGIELGDPRDLAALIAERIEPLQPFDTSGLVRRVRTGAQELVEMWNTAWEPKEDGI